MTSEKEISIWVRLLLSVSEEANAKKERDVFGSLAAFLKKRKKEYLLPEIVRRFERAYLKKNKAELFLARDHSPKTIGKFKKKIILMFGRKKNIDVIIEKDIIGGFRIKTNDILIKASVADFLKGLKDEEYRII